MNSQPKNTKNGFTVIEMVISIAIGMVILGMTHSLFFVQRDSFNVQEQLTGMQQNMRAAMDLMTAELMMAGYGTSSTNIFPVFESGTITFFADFNNDGDAEQIRYGLKWEDSENPPIAKIERGVITGSGTGTSISSASVAEGIEDLTFEPGNNIDGATDTVTITIRGRTADSEPNYTGDGYRRGTLTSTVNVRNL